MANLLCRNCDITQPEYQGPVCAECDGPMVEFVEPIVSFACMDAGKDLMFALPDTRPAQELTYPLGFMTKRQAGGR